MKQSLFSWFKQFNQKNHKKWITPQFSIVSHFYQDHTIHVLLQDRKGKKITHEVQNIAKQKELIVQLSAMDAFLLGYLVAEDVTAKSL